MQCNGVVQVYYQFITIERSVESLLATRDEASVQVETFTHRCKYIFTIVNTIHNQLKTFSMNWSVCDLQCPSSCGRWEPFQPQLPGKDSLRVKLPKR